MIEEEKKAIFLIYRKKTFVSLYNYTKILLQIKPLLKLLSKSVQRAFINCRILRIQ